MLSNNVRLQNLRDFTVQIRHINTRTIVGTGIVVSTDGKVATCAHVVNLASVNLQSSDNETVIVYFPQIQEERYKEKQAKVTAYFPQFDDDIVLLQLVNEASSIPPDQVAVVGIAEFSEFHSFRSYGYRHLDEYIAAYAEGKILGIVESPQGRRILCEPVQLQSSQINQGMSGAPVLDIERNLVIGIISETWYPDQSTKDRDTAWAVNTRILSLEPLNLPLHQTSLPLREASRPQFNLFEIPSLENSRPYISLHGVPPDLEEWVGREHLLKSITNDWRNPYRKVTSLIGFGGEGKTSIARQWLSQISSAHLDIKPDGIFWWNFYAEPDVENFFKAALEYVIGKSISQLELSIQARVHFIAAMLSVNRYLFIMDGMEIVQYQSGDKYGLITSDELRMFLEFFAGTGHNSFCLITSRAPVLDLIDYTTYTHRDINRLDSAEGISLLSRIGVKGDETKLHDIVEKWDGHALTLSLLGTFLVDKYAGHLAQVEEIPLPTSNEPRYNRVHSRHYRE